MGPYRIVMTCSFFSCCLETHYEDMDDAIRAADAATRICIHACFMVVSHPEGVVYSTHRFSREGRAVAHAMFAAPDAADEPRKHRPVTVYAVLYSDGGIWRLGLYREDARHVFRPTGQSFTMDARRLWDHYALEWQTVTREFHESDTCRLVASWNPEDGTRMVTDPPPAHRRYFGYVADRRGFASNDGRPIDPEVDRYARLRVDVEIGTVDATGEASTIGLLRAGEVYSVVGHDLDMNLVLQDVPDGRMVVVSRSVLEPLDGT